MNFFVPLYPQSGKFVDGSSPMLAAMKNTQTYTHAQIHNQILKEKKKVTVHWNLVWFGRKIFYILINLENVWFIIKLRWDKSDNAGPLQPLCLVGNAAAGFVIFTLYSPLNF